MPDITEMTDLDTTIHLLQQDPASASPAVAVALIERWEQQLQGSDIFENLTELKQAILASNTTEISKILSELGHKTSAAAADAHEQASADTIAKIQQIGELLSQAGHASQPEQS